MRKMNSVPAFDYRQRFPAIPINICASPNISQLPRAASCFSTHFATSTSGFLLLHSLDPTRCCATRAKRQNSVHGAKEEAKLKIYHEKTPVRGLNSNRKKKSLINYQQIMLKRATVTLYTTLKAVLYCSCIGISHVTWHHFVK